VKAISLSGIGVRFAFAFSLVCLTWNPSPVNFYRWAVNQWSAMTPSVVFVGIALLIGWVVFMRATARALGPIGIVLAVALAGSILWSIIYYNLIDPANSTTLAWVMLTLFAAILTAGMSWSHLRRRWSGQADVDDVDDVGN
jgi:hypothetical protein